MLTNSFNIFFVIVSKAFNMPQVLFSGYPLYQIFKQGIKSTKPVSTTFNYP